MNTVAHNFNSDRYSLTEYSLSNGKYNTKLTIKGEQNLLLLVITTRPLCPYTGVLWNVFKLSNWCILVIKIDLFSLHLNRCPIRRHRKYWLLTGRCQCQRKGDFHNPCSLWWVSFFDFCYHRKQRWRVSEELIGSYFTKGILSVKIQNFFIVTLLYMVYNA